MLRESGNLSQKRAGLARHIEGNDVQGRPVPIAKATSSYRSAFGIASARMRLYFTLPTNPALSAGPDRHIGLEVDVTVGIERERMVGGDPGPKPAG